MPSLLTNSLIRSKPASEDKSLLFTPFSATHFAIHRIYANRINSRRMSRVFCDLRSQKTPRGILSVNSNDKSPPSKFIFICLLLSKAKMFTILIKGSFGLFFKIRHLNFTTNGCSFFIHLIGETAIFN